MELLLKDLRKSKDLTQNDVAIIMKTKQAAVSRIEQKPLHVTVRTFLAYLKAVGATPDRVKEIVATYLG